MFAQLPAKEDKWSCQNQSRSSSFSSSKIYIKCSSEDDYTNYRNILTVMQTLNFFNFSAYCGRCHPVRACCTCHTIALPLPSDRPNPPGTSAVCALFQPPPVSPHTAFHPSVAFSVSLPVHTLPHLKGVREGKRRRLNCLWEAQPAQWPRCQCKE